MSEPTSDPLRPSEEAQDSVPQDGLPEAAFGDLLQKLSAQHPELFRDGQLQPDALLERLQAPTRFGLQWSGKAAARALARASTQSTLVPEPDRCRRGATPPDCLVVGDNLEVLKVLRRSLSRRVRLIFIDPPYNTGGDFVYPDSFQDGVAAYLSRTGQVDAGGQPLTPNPETSGRFHTNWLQMMLPRLVLARELLADDGALVVTIDDHEQHHLRLLLDEVFGRSSFVACCAWQKTFAKKNKALISGSHDHVLIYAKDIRRWDRNLLPRRPDQLTAYRNPDEDPRGRWQSVAYSVPSEDGHRRAPYRYGIETPSGSTVYPPAGRHWNGRPERTAELRADGRLWFGPKGDRRPRLKVFLAEVQTGIVPDTWWPHTLAGHTQEAKKELLDLLPEAEPFSTPKPTRLLRHILQIATRPHTNDLVLDFFAGSGTTGHAVWQQNAEDGGNRRFVLVQIPHPTGLLRHPTIADLTIARLHRAADRLVASPEVELGLRVLRLAPAALDEAGHLVQVDLPSPLDLRMEIALRLGCMPSVRFREVELAGLPCTEVGEGVALVCLVDAVSAVDCERLACAFLERSLENPEDTPPVVVFRESAFPTDGARMGLVHALRAVGVPRVWTL